ncbi:MAG: amino acid ABC transporter ATP-binding protein [Selenomonadaceae bacterium]|nr:amino acid ABC transporter ATP-binding protein [Selenomonadaceae bacterium]
MNVLSIKGLKKSFGDLNVLENLNLDVKEGEIISVIGASGCGKSVFLRCINRLETPDEGVIIVNGEEITAKNADINRIRMSMGMVFQNFRLFSHMNVMDNLCLAPLKLLNMPKKQAEDKAIDLLTKVGLASRAYDFPKILSGGQQQRIAICRALMMAPKILLMDEPTSALDPTMVGEVLAVIRRLAKQRLTMIIVTHEMEFAEEASDRILFFADRGIYEEGAPGEIFKNPQKPKTIAFIKKLKSFEFEITYRPDFDLMKLMGGIIAFAEKYNVDRRRKYLMQQFTEDIVYGFFKYSFDNNLNVSVDIAITYDEISNNIKIRITSGGKQYNPFDEPTETDFEQVEHIARMAIKNAAKSFSYDYDDGKNTVVVEL